MINYDFNSREFINDLKVELAGGKLCFRNQSEIAKMFGFSQAKVSRFLNDVYENNEAAMKKLSVSELCKITASYGATPFEYFERDI